MWDRKRQKRKVIVTAHSMGSTVMLVGVARLPLYLYGSDNHFLSICTSEYLIIDMSQLTKTLSSRNPWDTHLNPPTQKALSGSSLPRMVGVAQIGSKSVSKALYGVVNYN